jgi:hypothetical protein
VGWEYAYKHSVLPALRQQEQERQLANLQLHPQSNGNGLLASVKGGPGKRQNGVKPILARSPDYFSLNISIAIPNTLTATLVGWNITCSLDRYGDFHWSPFGVEIGKSATIVSASLTANWLLQSNTPSQGQMFDFLTTNGFNSGGGYIGGGGLSWTPGSGFAGGSGLYSPQFGISYNFTPTTHTFNLQTPFNW